MASVKKWYSVFVKQIPWTCDKKDLRLYFSQFGTVLSISMPYERTTGLSKCFATIWFADRIAYQKALDHPKHILEHQKLIVFPSIEYTDRHYKTPQQE